MSGLPIGLVGVGAMGLPIGRALLDAGRQVVACDQRAEALAELGRAGAKAVDSPADLADLAPTVLTSLPTPEALEDVVGGSAALIKGRAVERVVDLSTCGPDTAERLSQRLMTRGVDYLDAPLSGGVAAAEARTLSVMASGNQELFEMLLPTLRAFAQQVFWVGPHPGQGQVLKLLNNLLSATAVAATAEVMRVGAQAGLDAQQMLDVFNASTGRNTATAEKFPRHVLTGRFASGFRLELMAKDVRLCLATAAVKARAAAMPAAPAPITQSAGSCPGTTEQAPDLGGIWRDGVYDNVHLISSRNTSGYPDAPMPNSWPNFPHREHVLQYLNDYVDRFDLRRRITFGHAVKSVVPIDEDGAAGWTVVTDQGRRDYDAVIIANGHLRVPRLPDSPGQFTGKSLHSSVYRRPGDLEGRVLVVGAGNSGCDIAVEAAQHGFDVSLSVRRGHWFLPKTLFGRPRAEALPAWLPAKLQQLALRAASLLVLGPNERYGLPKPRTSLSTEPPVVGSQLFHCIDHGRIRIYPEVEELEGDQVAFAGERRARVDTIVWATGFKVELPFLDADLLDWRNGIPLRVAAGTLPPNLANLYFIGLVTPGGGNFPSTTRKVSCSRT